MGFVAGTTVASSRIVCCGAAVGAVLLLDVAAAGSDGREWIAYVVSLKLSAECERFSIT